MRLRKWLWSFRDRLFSRFRLASGVSWFCRFFWTWSRIVKWNWKIEITKQRHANSGRFQCLRTTKKINYINHKTKKIAFLWFPRCSFLLFNLIRMSNLNFRVIPVLFCDFSVWKHHFSTTKKKTSGAEKTTNMKRIWPSYWAAPCKLIFIKSNLLTKKCRPTHHDLMPGIYNDSPGFFGPRMLCWNMPFKEKKRKQALTSRIFNYMSCTKNHGISTCDGLEIPEHCYTESNPFI